LLCPGVITGLVGLLLPGGPLLGQADTGARAAPNQSIVLDRRDVEAWLDGYMGLALRAGNVAGAVVVVVKDGSPLVQKGYGFADVAARTPVDAERTGFRPGSVSKLFTATAVMQLVEQGKLDLDRDVNGYLDFTLPPAFDAPITLREILTHRPGFGQITKGLGAIDPSKVESLEYHVKHHIPRRIYRPGTIPAYSNYGLVLAGYIVQRVSGEPFEQYVEHHIFEPLGMHRSTFVQPLPARFEADMSKGYLTAGDEPRPFEILGTMPAGGLTSTGADMARFMMAHLGEGRLDSARILRPETVQLMHRRATPDWPELNGMALGFRESSRNGHRIIGHGGDTYAFHADLELYLDANLGLFVGFNSLGGSGMDSNGLIGSLVEAFTNRYFPGPAVIDPPPAPTAVEHARMAAGTYLSSRHFERNFLSLFNVLPMHVSAKDDGTITISSEERADGRPKEWRETGPWQWRELGGPDRLGMIVDGGRVAEIRRSSDPATALVRAPAFVAGWNLPGLVGAVVILALSALAWPASLIVRRRYHLPPSVGGMLGGGQRLTGIVAIVALGFLLGWALILRAIMNLDPRLYGGGFDPWILVLQLVGLMVIVGAFALVWSSWRTVSGRHGWWAKVWSVLTAGAVIYVAWFGFVFGLITGGLDY
jgi:CubicO group peptidase (beta-lactamase class C family)